MTQAMPELTENVNQISANWTTPEPESPEPIPQGEPDILHNDLTPSIIDQARLSGWECQYYSFGKLDDQGTDFFNPGLVMREDGPWLLVRASGQHPQGFMYGQNSLMAFKLDDALKQPHYGKVLKWPVDNPMQHFEDPRGFYHETLGQTIVGCCTFLWNGPGDWTGALQVFGAFDDQWENKSMVYPKIGGNPGDLRKVQHKDFEKNWVWFLHENNLHLLYKANPWTVYSFAGRWSEKTEYKTEGISWSYGEIRGGTTPVRIGDLYFTFHHSSLPWKGRYRRYYAGALAFEATPPFTPKLITCDPLLTGSQNDIWAQRKPLVVFPCGALFKNNNWLVTMGVNDIKCAYLELSHKSLLERMVPVDQAGGAIFPDIAPVLSGENRRTRGSVDEVERPSAPGGELEMASPISNDPGEWTSTDQKSPAQTTLGPILSGEDKLPPNTIHAGPEMIADRKAAITREKRRAALVKARSARAAKRASVISEYKGGNDSVTYVDSDGKERFKSGVGNTKFIYVCSKPEKCTIKKRRKRRKRRTKAQMAEARAQALAEYEKTLAPKENPI